MEYVRIEHMFNFFPKTLKREYGDDDQLLSYGMTAWRKLNFPAQRFEKDINFQFVSNHKGIKPDDCFKINSIKVLYDGSSVNTSCQSPSTDIGNSILTNKDCSINLLAFLNSDYYLNNWVDVRNIKQPLDEDYLCRVENALPYHIWNLNKDSKTLTFDFLQGTIAIEYVRPVVDENGNYMLPREPDVIWEFMSAYTAMKVTEEWMFMNKANAAQLHQMQQIKASNLMADAKRKLIIINLDPELHRAMVTNEAAMIKMPQYVYDSFTNRYGVNISVNAKL